MIEGVTLASALRSADTLIAMVILGAIVTMFIRGDLLSRKVYEKLTENIIERVVAQVGTQIVGGVQQLLRDWEAGEVDRLQTERDHLVEELEWKSPMMRKRGK